MRRRLLNLLAALALVLCLTGCAALLRSRSAPLELWSRSGGELLLVVSCKGGAIELYAVSNGAAGLGQDELDISLLGLRYEQSAFVVGRSYEVAVPLWLWRMATAGVPLGLLAHRSWKRISKGKGFCHSCGYDLRATADRCPECGTAAAVLPPGNAPN
jgi:hypothetical protein